MCVFLPKGDTEEARLVPSCYRPGQEWRPRGKHPGLGNLSTLREPALHFPVRTEERPGFQLLSSS